MKNAFVSLLTLIIIGICLILCSTACDPDSLFDFFPDEIDPGNPSPSDNPVSDNCVMEILTQIEGPSALNLAQPNYSFSFPGPLIGPVSHIQGIARLADFENSGRMIMVDNGSMGLTLAFQKIEGATEGLFSSNQKFTNPVGFQIRNVPEYGKHDHPGGIQAHGNLVAVAMEQGDGTPAAVYFLKVPGRSVEFLQTLTIDGSHGEPSTIDKKSAQAVGFTQMNSGHYLVAVHGSYGILFYESDKAYIDESTEWQFRCQYQPDCYSYGSLEDECFDGSNAVNLVRDCAGKIYLLAMNGTVSWSNDYQHIQVFEVRLNHCGSTVLQKVVQQRKHVGGLAVFQKSFRWSGGTYISETGKIAIMNTKRLTGLGNVYMSHP